MNADIAGIVRQYRMNLKKDGVEQMAKKKAAEVKAIQELSQKVKDLEDEIRKLKTA